MSALSAPGASVQVLSINHPTEGDLVQQRSTEPRRGVWQVYVHERGRRPRLVDVDIPGEKFPGTITVAGCSYHWVGADISQRTLTYSNFKATP